jgi:hypothetical protein
MSTDVSEEHIASIFSVEYIRSANSLSVTCLLPFSSESSVLSSNRYPDRDSNGDFLHASLQRYNVTVFPLIIGSVYFVSPSSIYQFSPFLFSWFLLAHGRYANPQARAVITAESRMVSSSGYVIAIRTARRIT